MALRLNDQLGVTGCTGQSLPVRRLRSRRQPNKLVALHGNRSNLSERALARVFDIECRRQRYADRAKSVEACKVGCELVELSSKEFELL